MMLDKTERVNKNIQEAKVIVNNLDDVFKHFQTLKDILPQIKSADAELGDDPEVTDMLGSLGWPHQRPKPVLQIRRRGLHEKHQG